MYFSHSYNPSVCFTKHTWITVFNLIIYPILSVIFIIYFGLQSNQVDTSRYIIQEYSNEIAENADLLHIPYSSEDKEYIVTYHTTLDRIEQTKDHHYILHTTDGEKIYAKSINLPLSTAHVYEVYVSQLFMLHEKFNPYFYKENYNLEQRSVTLEDAGVYY